MLDFSEDEKEELRMIKEVRPESKVIGVKLSDGSFHLFVSNTIKEASEFAVKNNGFILCA